MNVALWGGIALFASRKKRKPIIGSSEAVITEAMENYRGKHHNSIMSLFQGAGFTNVTAIPLNDLSFFTQGRNGQVDSVSVNGRTDFEEGDVYPKSANVQITYHSR